MKVGLFDVLDVYDFSVVSNSNEFRFEASLFEGGVRVERTITNVDGIYGDTRTRLDVALLRGSPTAPFVVMNARLAQLLIYEDDGWSGRDDFFDAQINGSANVNGSALMQYPRFRGGSDRCGYVNGNGNYNCPLYEPDGSVFYFKQINFNLWW